MDSYCYKQSSLEFIKELKKPVHFLKPEGFGTRLLRKEEIDMTGMYLQVCFPDVEGLLDTAYDDFRNFLRVYEIGGNRYPVTIVKGETTCFEEYQIDVTANGCSIMAGDTEGIRRGLFFLEDLIIESQSAALKPLCVVKRPVIKTRITRGFFSPTNRPPRNIDELYDDIDYYPEEYLNRLAHDGNNGIWIYIRFSDLLSSDIISEYGAESEKRLRKLRTVVKKCAKYGIKVYVFGCEPAGLSKDMIEKYPELVGAPAWTGGAAICARTEKGREYCIETTYKLFTAIPELGGYIDITAGERITTCASFNGFGQCPNCKKYSRGETLAYTADLIKEGMRRAGSKGEFISWTYEHRNWDFNNIREYVKSVPKDIMLMQNFEDLGYEKQLGKERLAIDYWLSYVGPSMLFEETAKAANTYEKSLYAKLQVCCSHELASVPYIPVPGLLFEKYAAAHKYHVTGIVQCWYFGNYPSIMSKAAGQLAFMEDFGDKDQFLRHLAGTCYGKSHAENVAKAWASFEEGYRNYPINIMFSYYGPMHDGVVWELALLPKNKALPRSWLLLDRANGDRIGEALQCGHDLEEAIELVKQMRDNWRKGLLFLAKEDVGEQFVLAKALGILFDSGLNILRFYALREKLGYRKGNAQNILNKMRNIVGAEIKNSQDMKELCQQDGRLGYHSEAEGYKFSVEMLNSRVLQLHNLLETEFVTVQKRIDRAELPLAYYQAEGENAYIMAKGDPESEQWVTIGENAAFRVGYDQENLYLDVQCRKEAKIRFSFEFRLMWPSPEMVIKDGYLETVAIWRQHQSIFGNKLEQEIQKYKVTYREGGIRITADRYKCNWNEDTPIKLRLQVDDVLWTVDKEPVSTLGKGSFSPGEFGWLKC